ncbi:MAG: pseudaminic acid cytidylyltransferase [Lachnospiraceae bacterium]|nr:pseudaminic acid cytidylyltransferase [Lachnospiraceae bacterium]
MNAVAIITARGGSKRIPRKNIKEFLGKPILMYSIESAINSGVFEEVMVSTEDEEIAELARKAGAKVPFMRGADNANDYATTTDVLLEVLEEYAKVGKNFEFGCCIYPTAPFVTAEKLAEGMNRLKDSDADTLIPVVPFSFPPQRAMVIRNDKLQFRMPEHALTRSQDLEHWYHDAGQFYCFRTENFRQNKILTVGNVLPLVVSELEVQDIDTFSDWQIAEMKYAAMMEKK